MGLPHCAPLVGALQFEHGSAPNLLVSDSRSLLLAFGFPGPIPDVQGAQGVQPALSGNHPLLSQLLGLGNEWMVCGTLPQFWIHTEVIDKLPAPIEFIFSTPSHHRVHHGYVGSHVVVFVISPCLSPPCLLPAFSYVSFVSFISFNQTQCECFVIDCNSCHLGPFTVAIARCLFSLPALLHRQELWRNFGEVSAQFQIYAIICYAG